MPQHYCYIFIFSVAFFLMACGEDNPNVKAAKKEWQTLDSMQVTERVFDSKISYTDSGYLRAVIRAPLIEQHGNAKNPYIELPKGLTADFYNGQKTVESKLVAGYGINFLDSKIIEVRKQVEVINTKNEKLKTERLFWDQNLKEIYTTDAVEITTENEKLFGTGMRAAQDFSTWKITNVTGIVTLK